MTKYLFLGFLIVIAVNVWLVNFRRRKRDPEAPRLLQEEGVLAHVEFDGSVSTIHGLLTTARIHRASNRWLFSRRDSQMAQLKDIHSVSWQTGLSLGMLFLGLALIGIYSPLGILLVMYALQTPIAAVGFQSHFLPRSLFSRVGIGVSRSHIVFQSGNREDFLQLRRLYEASLNAWSKARHRVAPDQNLDTVLTGASSPIVPLFAWSSVVWLAVWAVFAIASGQRIIADHVVLDHPLFGALYLALPLAITLLEGTRAGLWTALLTFLMLLAVKFPAGFLLGWALNDGFLQIGQSVAVFISMILIVLLGGAIHRRGVSVPAEVAIVVIWPITLLFLDSGSIQSYRTWALVLLAVGICRLGTIFIPAILSPRWLQRTARLGKDVADLLWGPAV